MPLPKTKPPASSMYAALVTPRRPDSTETDAAAFLDYLDKVAATGVSGLVFFGSTGEFVHFDVAERIRLTSLGVKRSPIPVLVNVSHSTLSGARQLAEDTMASGAAGVLLMPPYFFRYSDDAVRRFYESFTEQVDQSIPVYLYHLPQFTNALSIPVVTELLRSGRFAGIKDSSGDLAMFEHLHHLHGDAAFQWLSGNEQFFENGLRAPADGFVSGIAAAVPELMLAAQRQFSEELNTKMKEFLAWVERLPTPVIIKQAAALRKWVPFEPAVPLSAAAQQNLAQFSAWFSRWLPETLIAAGN